MNITRSLRLTTIIIVFLIAAATLWSWTNTPTHAATHFVASGGGGSTLFINSAVEHPDGTVTLPLHRGLSHGKTCLLYTSDAADE